MDVCEAGTPEAGGAWRSVLPKPFNEGAGSTPISKTVTFDLKEQGYRSTPESTESPFDNHHAYDDDEWGEVQVPSASFFTQAGSFSGRKLRAGPHASWKVILLRVDFTIIQDP